MNFGDITIAAILLAGIYSPAGAPKDPGYYPLSPNMKMSTEIELTGTHLVYSSTTPLRESGQLKISTSELGLSLTLLGLEYLNWNGTVCRLPSINILKNATTAYTFFADAVISYHGAKNCLLQDSDQELEGRKKTRLFLLNTGEQIYFSWTVYAADGSVILDETFHSRKKKESACAFVNGRLICK